MKRKDGTTDEQWAQYAKDKEAFDLRMIATEPMPFDFEDGKDYDKAYSQWSMARSMDAPNKPGYYRANND